MNKHLYILVADSGRAKVFRAETPLASLETVYDKLNYRGRQKVSEVYADRAGRQQTGSGGYHSFAGERETHEDERFSRELCKFLCDEYQRGKFDTLILTAPPPFMGQLRKHLRKTCRKVLLNTIDKDLVKLSEQDIIAQVLQGNPDLNLPAMH